jgi:Protein of unknown function (DUF3631)
LLADLKVIFGDAKALHQDHPRPPPPAGGVALEGPVRQAFDPRGLSRRLHPYGIKPVDVRETGDGPNLKGYKREDLHDAWTRYLVRDMRDVGDSPGQAVADRSAVADLSATWQSSATGTSSDVAAVAAVAEEGRLFEHDPDDPGRWSR